MEVLPRLYAHSKYTRYLPAVVYGSYIIYHGCGYSTVCTVGRQWFTLYMLYTGGAFDLVIVQVTLDVVTIGYYYTNLC